ncbi:MAG: hypothetical protein MRJ96_02240 [Nitrospirales bacterium]|nr:hypothetical protein [Nitrospira sp.]MDR4500264.1 hypothetical protein [Nitrospirales bacterium]
MEAGSTIKIPYSGALLLQGCNFRRVGSSELRLLGDPLTLRFIAEQPGFISIGQGQLRERVYRRSFVYRALPFSLFVSPSTPSCQYRNVARGTD